MPVPVFLNPTIANGWTFRALTAGRLFPYPGYLHYFDFTILGQEQSSLYSGGTIFIVRLPM